MVCILRVAVTWFVFFFNDTATTEIYTLSLHDALPISRVRPRARPRVGLACYYGRLEVTMTFRFTTAGESRSEEHTSELQSQSNLVCRLLLEKKKTTQPHPCLLDISLLHHRLPPRCAQQ